MPSIPHIMDYTGDGWIGVATMFLLLIFFLALGVSGSHFVQKVAETNNPRRRAVNFRNEQQDVKSAILLAIASVVGVALCVFVFAWRLNWLSGTFIDFLIVAAVSFVYVMAKYVFYCLIDSLFDLRFKDYRIWLFLIFAFFGFCCIILCLVATRTPALYQSLFALGGVLVISLVAEFFVLVKNFSANPASVFYIFLYLCTSEILPFLVGFRVISNVLN